MARTPPQAASPRRPVDALHRAAPRRHRPAARLALVVLGCLLAVRATPMRSAPASSGPPTSRPSRGASRYGAETTRTGSRSRPANAFAPATPCAAQSSSRATITLARRRHVAARREQRAGASGAAVGTRLADRVAARRHSRHQPRSALAAVHDALRQRGPRGHRVRHSRRREQPSDRDHRARRRSRRDDAGRRAQRRERPHRGREGRAKRRPRRRTRRRSSGCAGQATTRRSSIARSPVRTKSRPQPSEPTPTFYAYRAAARLATARIEAAEADIASCPTYRPAERDGAVAERPPRARARRPGRPRATLSGRRPRRRAALGRRADWRCRTSSRASAGAGGGRPHAARGARDRARQQPSSSRGSPRSLWRAAMRAAAIANATRARTLGADAKRPARRARLRQPSRRSTPRPPRALSRQAVAARARRSAAAARAGACPRSIAAT